MCPDDRQARRRVTTSVSATCASSLAVTVVDDIQTVLASTVYYSRISSPEMTERAEIIKSMATSVNIIKVTEH
ncbi:MAG: hypothetical protein QOI25_1646 [Mycobacterium sp.]|jgi:hypothetical protein|nr:hypothetical protein [Mycobacterium sp.]